MEQSLRIVYMGTPEFAVYPLECLINSKHTVAAVVTAVDKPAGRGQKLMQSAVKIAAELNGIPVLQPTNLKSEEFIAELASYNPDIIVVIAFRMLPKVLWSLPKLGTINLHASLLPQYRGAAPINWAVVNGETETGITSFYINEAIDTGNVILQEKLKLPHDYTAGKLHDSLMKLSGDVVLKTLDYIINNPNQGISQNSLVTSQIELKHAPKLSKEICRINWTEGVETIYNHIRGFSPYPAAWSLLEKDGNAALCKILFAEFEIDNHTLDTGTVVLGKDFIKIAANNGFIIPKELQLEGKKRMQIADCMRGYAFDGTKFI